jgi:transcriptional regulator of aromatic amino acid metabolism
MERGANGWSHGLVGQSPQICEIRRLIEKLGHSHAPVLLLGESGTGKEVVARAIHAANPSGEFVAIDCGALVGPLLESELFGHTKGAFTGAAEAKRGLIEVADGGTAFFDEIGDLPLDMQVKLLRLLQEREFRPVGSLKQHKVNIRVIAATHHDLTRDAARGAFREDLYYRLNIVRLHLPALRHGGVEYRPLAAHRRLAFIVAELPGGRTGAGFGGGRGIGDRAAALAACAAAAHRIVPGYGGEGDHPEGPGSHSRRPRPGGPVAGHRPHHALPQAQGI